MMPPARRPRRPDVVADSSAWSKAGPAAVDSGRSPNFGGRRPSWPGLAARAILHRAVIGGPPTHGAVGKGTALASWAPTTCIMSQSVQRPAEFAPASAGRLETSAFDEIEALHVPVRRAGIQAKCSFLLSVLSSESSSAAERASAFVGLVDDIDSIVRALDQDDLLRLRELFDRVLTASAAEATWWITCFPDTSVTDSSAIDGTNVRRVVAEASVDGAVSVDVARVEVPGGIDAVVVSEYTCAGVQQAAIVAIDEGTGDVVAECRLPGGHNRRRRHAGPTWNEHEAHAVETPDRK